MTTHRNTVPLNPKTTDMKILRFIAEHSPKHFAYEIRKRYTWAIKTLERMIKENFFYNDGVYIHCSHCSRLLDSKGRWQYNCRACLYFEAFKKLEIDHRTYICHCTTVRFNNIKLANATLVSLSHDRIAINKITINILRFLNGTTRQPDPDELTKSLDYCKAHVAWTYEPFKWGKYV